MKRDFIVKFVYFIEYKIVTMLYLFLHDVGGNQKGYTRAHVLPLDLARICFVGSPNAWKHLLSGEFKSHCLTSGGHQNSKNEVFRRAPSKSQQNPEFYADQRELSDLTTFLNGFTW
jgi:hypothetical protein